MKASKSKIAIVVLAVCLVLALLYIAVDKYAVWRQQEQLGVFQAGAQYGYEQAVIQLVQQSLTCQQVPLRVQNETINIIAVDCLQQG